MSDTLTTSLEISMYPLQDEYLTKIEDFLFHIHKVEGIKVQTNVMSTQLFGPLDLVFDTVKEAIKQVYSDGTQCPFAIKVLNTDISAMEVKDFKK